MFKNCQTCKKEFSKPINCSRTNWEKRKYCSKKCCILQLTLECQECKGYFKVRQYRKDIAHFCSKTCASQFRNQGKRTEDKIVRQSAKYKAWRTLVFERDNYTCQHCGNTNGNGETIYFHADHIKPFALYPEFRFEISNGRTLCVPCHKKTDTWGRGAIYRKVNIASC